MGFEGTPVGESIIPVSQKELGNNHDDNNKPSTVVGESRSDVRNKGQEGQEGAIDVRLAVGLAAFVVLACIGGPMLETQIRDDPAAVAQAQSWFQDLSQYVSHVMNTSDIAKMQQQGAEVVGQKANEAGHVLKVVAPNAINNTVEGAAQGVDKAQEAVLGNEAVRVEASIYALENRGPEIILPASPENAPKSPDDYAYIYGFTNAAITDMKKIVMETDQIPAVNLALGAREISSGELDLSVFAMARAQKIGTELGSAPGGIGFGRVTQQEVKYVWEKLGSDGRTQLQALLNVSSEKELFGKMDKDPNANFAVSRALFALKGRDVVDLLKNYNGLTLSPETKDALVMAEYLKPGWADKLLSHFKGRVGGNLTHQLFPNIEALLKYSSGDVDAKKKLVAYLVSKRADQELWTRFNKTKQAPRYALVYDQRIIALATNELKRETNWDFMSQINWDDVATSLIEQYADVAQ